RRDQSTRFLKRPASRNAVLADRLSRPTRPAQASIRKDREVFQHCPELTDGRSKVQRCRNDDLRKRSGRKTTGDEDTERVRLERSHRYWRHRKRGMAGSLRPTLGESRQVTEHMGPRVQSSSIAILHRNRRFRIEYSSKDSSCTIRRIVGFSSRPWKQATLGGRFLLSRIPWFRSRASLASPSTDRSSSVR